MVERIFLIRALDDLGIKYEEGDVKIRGYGGRKSNVEIRIPTNSSGYDIGFQKGASGYECIADWFGVRGFEKNSFVQKVSQRYAYHVVRVKLEAQGFALAEEQTEKDGRIHLVLRRAT